MVAADLEFAPVLQRGVLVGTLSRKSALRSTLYQPALDSGGRLLVAAALGINGDVGARRAPWSRPASTCWCSTPRTGTRAR